MASQCSVDTIHHYSVLMYKCQCCGSKPGDKCISLSTKKVMDKKMHHARLQSLTGNKIFGVKM
jgi:hypothetical protein